MHPRRSNRTPVDIRTTAAQSLIERLPLKILAQGDGPDETHQCPRDGYVELEVALADQDQERAGAHQDDPEDVYRDSPVGCGGALPDPILKLKWPVPLTLDCELGYDWTVPWNLVEFREGKEPWPEALKPYFPKAIAALAAKGSPAVEAPAVPQAPQEPRDEAEPVESPPAAEPGSEPATKAEEPQSTAPNPPAMEKGEIFVYKLRKPLRQGVVESLARVLHECKNRGSHPIEIRTSDGESVVWKSSEFTVNPTQFSILADRQGI